MKNNKKEYKKKKGFTLAETLIVLSILGIIAVLTVPAIIQKHAETNNRSRLKKAMAAYETALNKMVIENDIKNNHSLYENNNSFAPANNCTHTSVYFKASNNIVENGVKNICKFKTTDGTFWDISNINRPIIAFSEASLNDVNAKDRFQFTGYFDKKDTLRVNDFQYEINNGTESDKDALIKVYSFLYPKQDMCVTTSCIIKKYKDVQCTGGQASDYTAEACTNCSNCSYSYNNGTGSRLYNKKGKVILDASGCTNGKNCLAAYTVEYDQTGETITKFRIGCNGDGTECKQCYSGTMQLINCD